MKAQILSLIISLATTLPAFAQLGLIDIDFDLKNQRASSETVQTILNNKLVQQAIVELAETNEKSIVVVTPNAKQERQEEIQVLGLSQRQALDASGDRWGTEACSVRHLQGDIANRWCHGLIGKGAALLLENKGMDPKLAAILAVALQAPKEFLVDQNASPSDFVLTYGDKLGRTSRASFEVSAFGDGGFYISLKRKFGPQL